MNPQLATVLSPRRRAYRGRSGTVFGILFTVALTSGMLMLWLAGHAGLRAVS